MLKELKFHVIVSFNEKSSRVIGQLIAGASTLWLPEYIHDQSINTCDYRVSTVAIQEYMIRASTRVTTEYRVSTRIIARVHNQSWYSDQSINTCDLQNKSINTYDYKSTWSEYQQYHYKSTQSEYEHVWLQYRVSTRMIVRAHDQSINTCDYRVQSINTYNCKST